MALDSLFTMEIQLVKRKRKICQMVFGLQKKPFHFLGIFLPLSLLDRCLIELTNVTYGFGIM